MPDYDPTAEVLIAGLREALAPPDAQSSRTYVDDLRAVQQALVTQLAQDTSEAPPPEAEQTMRQALGRLDPKNEDQWLGIGEVARRLLSCVDKQLFVWTSGLVQPVGPSGDAQGPEVDLAPVAPQ